MPPVKNRIHVIESRLLGPSDLTNFNFHFARAGQFNLFGRTENPILVYRMNCLRHSRSVTCGLLPSQDKGPDPARKDAGDDERREIRCRLYVAYRFSVALTHFPSEHWRKIRASRG